MSKEIPPPTNARFATSDDFSDDNGMINGLEYFEYNLGYRRWERATTSEDTDQHDLRTRIIMNGIAIKQNT